MQKIYPQPGVFQAGSPESRQKKWRRGPESNRSIRFCRPLPNRLATTPRVSYKITPKTEMSNSILKKNRFFYSYRHTIRGEHPSGLPRLAVALTSGHKQTGVKSDLSDMSDLSDDSPLVRRIEPLGNSPPLLPRRMYCGARSPESQGAVKGVDLCP